MTSKFSARKIGRQWQIFQGEEFYCRALLRGGRPATNAADAALHAERLNKSAAEAAEWDRTVAAARAEKVAAYLARRAQRPQNLAFNF